MSARLGSAPLAGGGDRVSDAVQGTLVQHLWNHRDEPFTFLRLPEIDATSWWAELAIRFGVILSQVWGVN